MVKDILVVENCFNFKGLVNISRRDHYFWGFDRQRLPSIMQAPGRYSVSDTRLPGHTAIKQQIHRDSSSFGDARYRCCTPALRTLGIKSKNRTLWVKRIPGAK